MVLMYLAPLAQAARGTDFEEPLPALISPDLTFPEYKAPETGDEKKAEKPAPESEKPAKDEPAPESQSAPAPQPTPTPAPATQPAAAPQSQPAQAPVVADDYAVTKPKPAAKDEEAVLTDADDMGGTLAPLSSDPTVAGHRQRADDPLAGPGPGPGRPAAGRRPRR